ncbi:MAG TPA: 23S rRNA (adenine(2503)-C(2))-methyltransferase RlmN [Lachnospiraceae bacterium]|nr:23S rRNA (adenine(2503)-C(2))-methyltransferase RlmN [Lachnospiraceae bacterium]
MMKDLKAFTLEQLLEEMRTIGEKPFRAKQIYEWSHQKLARSYDEMTNISASLKERLRENYSFVQLSVVRMQESQLDKTRKYLFALPDGHMVETVWMKYHHGNSVCISSQVGCRMGCRFCASTLDGLARSLSASEMLEQIYEVTRQTGERVSNVVVMGTGEPLDNYDNLLQFLRMLTDEFGLHISQRNVTVSTCGLVPKMRELAKEHLQITLALSLHATLDERRKEIMPIANTYTIAQLMEACAYYFEQTGRRITFEYSLIGGVNDSEQEAERLAELAAPLNCHVNLIPINPVKEREYKESSRASVLAFKNKLEKKQINVTIRREMGRDIDGACGQLRRQYVHKQEEQQAE